MLERFPFLYATEACAEFGATGQEPCEEYVFSGYPAAKELGMRVFLVVIDETDEARSALRYAARRAGA
ncbi:MAG TPA: hypothetical protein VK839_05505, partial [Erythrobacter sp.]|nr:hypothetical protein [Erythrobacter sp.]